MLSHFDANTATIRHLSANACLTPLLSLNGYHVTTVEGIGSTKGGNIHPVQRRVAALHGSQCGFCTPGRPSWVFDSRQAFCIISFVHSSRIVNLVLISLLLYSDFLYKPHFYDLHHSPLRMVCVVTRHCYGYLHDIPP